MNQIVEKCTASLFDALSEEGLADKATVVLVGSSARGVMNSRSDVDILVLKDEGRRLRIEHPGDIHLQQESRSGFLRRLQEGDDYPGWALRYGIPLRDPDGWWGHTDSRRAGKPALAGLAPKD